MKEAQDPDNYADKAERLAWVQELEKAGHVDVFYGDESGFCLTSAIPYGWQFPGEHVATRPRHSPRFNVLYSTRSALRISCRQSYKLV